jgi:hypothetical protein
VGQVDEDLRLVVESELMLLRPEVRRDSARLLAFLHEDFTEYGASGRVWDRSTITEVTVGATGKIDATDVAARRVGPDAVVVTYRTHVGGRHALRSSIWVRQSGSWLLLFHQGTLVSGT